MYRAADRVQSPRPTDVGRLTTGAAKPEFAKRPIRSDRAKTKETIDMSHHTYANEEALVDATGRSPTSTTRTSASSRSTSTRRPTSRATSRAPSPGTGRASCPTGSAATSPAARTSARCCPTPGIGPDTTIVLYGDNNNWFAAWAYWQLKLYGHRDVRILNGGRKYWLDNGLAAERRRAELPGRPATSFPSPTSACGRSATTSCRGSATPSSRSSTSARRPSSTARSSRRRA